ncbi:ubiquitin metalloprotease fusion [Fusarium albosuccineum]|uniref:Ubiquitin metalloprotease fusion n=1 Tax=Fusarium albosuccineum TaxID=1237068 RepID=A0A8H4PFJ7_9HYPO|nr:ubiquitin metalloprotease fusion [Fusarium albosuccineum]
MADSPMSDDASTSEHAWLTLSVTHRKVTYELTFPEDATIADLFDEIEASLNIPVANQKIMAPKTPLLKAPFKNPDMPLLDLKDKPLTLMGSPAAEVQEMQNMADRVAKRNAARMAQRSKARHLPSRKSAEDTQYTFLQVKPLQGLPHPERSQKLLLRLKEDPGIRAAMKKHKFTVALLTEMEPLSHTQTTHEGTSRILGLNRNKGEAIELRLRTDAHDGYRDYKTIRKTLCHELAHNVHGPHDRNFWDLCHQIEREVEAADWKSGGHTIGETSRYTISGEDEEEFVEDHGGWTGGEFVLGGGRNNTTAGMSRREILAQAAIERQRKEVEAERKVLEAANKAQRRTPPTDDSK